jgi:peroxiredoxin Q/BCP
LGSNYYAAIGTQNGSPPKEESFMAGKRSTKRSKSRRPKKIKKQTSKAARRPTSRSRPKARAKSRPKAASKKRVKSKGSSKRAAGPKTRRVARGVGKVRTARVVGVSKPPGVAPAAMAARPGSKGKSRIQARASGRGAPQGLLEFDEGAVATELVRDPALGPIPPIPKKRRGKANQLNMLDYPGESLTVGMQAPELSLPSTLGRRVSLNEFRGKRVILYFYPKDDTPGCTMEACGFRDSFPRIESKDAIVLGVSLDDELSHERFAQKYNLPFPLLSDKDAAVSRQYGTYKEKNLYGRSFWGIERTTFVIDREGKVEHVFRRVKVEGHAEEVMATLAL